MALSVDERIATTIIKSVLYCLHPCTVQVTVQREGSVFSARPNEQVLFPPPF
jgi:hypothetical protein